jgi:hypothetical protein
MFAGRRWADAQLLGDEHATYPITNEIPVNLGREMPPWLFEPREDLQAALVGEGFDDNDRKHVG